MTAAAVKILPERCRRDKASRISVLVNFGDGGLLYSYQVANVRKKVSGGFRVSTNISK